MTVARTMIVVVLALSMNPAFAESHSDRLRLYGTNSVFVAPRQTVRPQSVPPRKTPTQNSQAEKEYGIKGNPIAGIPLSSLIATRERPIFSPSRRPPPMGTHAAVVPIRNAGPGRPSLTLLGAISAGNQGMAIFLDEKNGKVIRTRIGEGVSGWTLRRVNGREAILENNQQRAVLSMPDASDK